MELELVRLIRDFSSKALERPGVAEGVVRSIGDDCAVLAPPEGFQLLVTTDVMTESVHFDLDYFTPHDLGMRLAAANLSDVAAMGGVPRYAFLNLEIPHDAEHPAAGQDAIRTFWHPFLQGLCCKLAHYGAALTGGDTVSGRSGLSLSLTVIGQVEKDGALLRSRARPGELLFVSGWPGEAAAGLDLLAGRLGSFPSHRGPNRRLIRRLVARHLRPEPRVELGRYLARHGASACIDISDGMATDAAHIAEESGCGIVIEEGRLPVSRAMRLMAMTRGRTTSQRRWLRDKILRGGEDFELLWTVPEEMAEGLCRLVRSVCGVRATRIGRVVEGAGVLLETVTGEAVQIAFSGYEH